MKFRLTNRIIRGVLLTADLLLLTLFAVGYAAVWISPKTLWWIQPTGVLLPLITVALALAGVLAMLLGAWRTAGLHVILVVLAVGRFVSFSGGAVGDATQTLRVMTLNARFSWDVRNAFPDNTVDSLVATEEPHVIALQEADILLERETREIAMLLPVEIRLTERGYRTFPPENVQRRQYNPVVARIPIERHSEFFVATTDEQRRAPTFTRSVVDYQGEDVAVYNVHLKSFSGTPNEERTLHPRLDPRSWPERWSIFRETYRSHAEQVDELVRMLREETLPFIVCGDLNSTPNNWSYRQLAEVSTDAWRAAGSGRGATYPALFPLVRIDYVFAGPGWTVRDIRVAEPAKSDHRAVIADLAR